MKILKIALISLGVFIAVLIAAAVIFVQTFDVNRYKPQIVAQAGKVLSRQVDFDRAKLGLSLFQGISLKIAGFTIAEAGDFGAGDFLSVKEISVGVDILGYLTRKKISVTGIIIDSPKVSIVRLKDGRINAQTLASPDQAGKELAKSEPAAAAVAIPAILVSSIRVTNGTAIYADNSFQPAMRLDVKDLAATITNISVGSGASGQLEISADLQLNNAELTTEVLASPVKNIKAKARISGNKLTIEQSSLSLGGGSIVASGMLTDYLGKQEYDFAAEVIDLKLQETVSQEKLPVKSEGIASAKIKVSGAGFTPEALKSSLSGNIAVSVVKAKLVELNVLRTVLDKIAILPGLSQSLQAGLPDRYKQRLAARDTELSDIKLPIVLQNGKAVINDLSLGADEFLFNGSGQAGLNGAYSLEGSFLIPQDLSSAMISQVKELQYLLNEQKNIFIPLKITGSAGQTSFSVDAGYIAKKLIATQARQQLFGVLEKAIGSKDSGTGASQEINSTAQQEGSGRSSSEEAVGNLLKGIFK